MDGAAGSCRRPCWAGRRGRRAFHRRQRPSHRSPSTDWTAVAGRRVARRPAFPRRPRAPDCPRGGRPRDGQRGTGSVASSPATTSRVKDRILVRNARQNNLKGFDLELPRRALVVLTGPSGSGKSSLAFDTLYAEGQRRYVESLSTYAKQFLERMEKPAVDAVEGISPAIAIEQKNPTKTSRSTVGTATEVYDYLRLLWARVGRTQCPHCQREVKPDTVQSAADAVLALPEGTRILITFPLPRSARLSHQAVVENLRVLGFVRVLLGSELLELDGDAAATPAGLGHDLGAAGLASPAPRPRGRRRARPAVPDELLVVVDRLVVRPDARERLADSLGTAFAEGEGEVVLVLGPGEASSGGRRLRFTERFRCPDHPEVRFLDPTPRLFSFNNPYGSCPTCTGFGATLEYDSALIIPNASRSLEEGAVDPWEMPRYAKYREKLLAFASARGVRVDRPWRELTEDFREAVLHGTRGFGGVIRFLRSREQKRYKQYIRVFLRRYQTARTCPACAGAKLRPEALYVHVAGLTIAQAAELTVEELRSWVESISTSGPGLSEHELEIAAPILRELRSRLRFLDDVGVGYLTLHRQTRTLSGGEAQRISLANSLGSSLVDALYVLDEPTVGLHSRDTDRLLTLLAQLRADGNTVLVVEHDAAAIRAADHVVELGPGSGEKGGELVYQGDTAGLLQADTVTGRFLSGRDQRPPRLRRRSVDGARLRLSGARLHNLQGLAIEIPLGALTVVTGVSGSGKSTLVHDVLYRALERELGGGETSAKQHLGEEVGSYDRLDGAAQLDAAVLVDQSPIGRTPRSNPVTYIKAFDHVREIFATQPLAKQRGYTPGHFSFNVRGGRCEACQGDGLVQVEMVFLADVFVPCEVCGGARYKPETLEVTYKGRNIRQVLDLTVDEAIRFFIKEDRLGQALWQLQQVGLGYLRLGQPAPSLSGGEAQRLKIARELAGAGRRQGRRIYVLDEPTTGLSGSEVRKLLEVFQRLLDVGHTVVVIEHNLEVIRAADWVIDLGPEAGDAGGRVVAMGRPEDVARVPESHTGRYLAGLLQESAVVPAQSS
ncbi:MAG: excinuclease ABC subunit UvrA [Gemmatimonadetes bacterium]|nr:excinuclease ABC subunit UvrA [Gemmatimonadota bacterium]